MKNNKNCKCEINGLSHTNGEDKTKGCGGNLQEKQKKISKIFVVRSGGDVAEPVYINI